MNGDPEWNRSLYFNLHDEKNDLTAFMRIGNKPNKGEKSMFLFVIKGKQVFGMRNAVAYDSKERECSGLEFSENGDGTWHIAYRGPFFDMASQEKVPLMSSMDVEWKPVNPLMDYHDCVDAKGAEMSSKTVSEHFEQFGVVSGRISLGDATYDIDATGERDFSEGVRDWGSPKMWMWLNSVYGKESGFNATKLCTQVGDVDAGYFGTAEGNDPVVGIEIDLSYDKGIPSGYRMKMHGKSGKDYAVDGKVLAHAVLPMQGSKDMLLVETISETVMDGRKGRGIAEFLVTVEHKD
ncbi:MAG: hypothetical protein IJ856_03845 [Candidatus Methanomethylophilaceae archaeon]|nr:hypothetical protein [Candidatus Methanomethylophilaceae archaeon]